MHSRSLLMAALVEANEMQKVCDEAFIANHRARSTVKNLLDENYKLLLMANGTVVHNMDGQRGYPLTGAGSESGKMMDLLREASEMGVITGLFGLSFGMTASIAFEREHDAVAFKMFLESKGA